LTIVDALTRKLPDEHVFKTRQTKKLRP